MVVIVSLFFLFCISLIIINSYLVLLSCFNCHHSLHVCFSPYPFHSFPATFPIQSFCYPLIPLPSDSIRILFSPSLPLLANSAGHRERTNHTHSQRRSGSGGGGGNGESGDAVSDRCYAIVSVPAIIRTAITVES